MSKEFNKKESVSYPHGQETLRAMNRKRNDSAAKLQKIFQ